MSTNKVAQRQVKSIRQEFMSLDEQLSHVEQRTRVVAAIIYENKTQWDLGLTKTNIDTNSTLDQIQLAKDGSVFFNTGTFMSYVLDGGAQNVSPQSFTYTHTKPGGTSILYYTRSGNTSAPDDTWEEWKTVTVSNAVQSSNARYFQTKIELSTTDTSITPKVASFELNLWGGVGSQELFTARGSYPSLAERLDNLNSVYHLKVIPGNGDRDIALTKTVVDNATLKVYLNGQLQSEGTYEEDAYTIISGVTVRFNFDLSSDDLVICRMEGAGAGVVTVKEARIVDEFAETTDHITYTLQRTPVTGKEEVYIGGIKMLSGPTNDYTITGNVITFNYATPTPDPDEVYHPRVTYSYVT